MGPSVITIVSSSTAAEIVISVEGIWVVPAVTNVQFLLQTFISAFPGFGKDWSVFPLAVFKGFSCFRESEKNNKVLTCKFCHNNLVYILLFGQDLWSHYQITYRLNNETYFVYFTYANPLLSFVALSRMMFAYTISPNCLKWSYNSSSFIVFGTMTNNLCRVSSLFVSFLPSSRLK